MGDEQERTWLHPSTPDDDGNTAEGSGGSKPDSSSGPEGTSADGTTDPTILIPEEQRGKVPAMQDPSLPEIPDVSLTAVIGRGGMGIVYRGTQSYLDREVAVKLMSTEASSESFAARFQREAKLLAGMTHTNIVGCYQAGATESNHCYIVMEFIDGPDLGQWVRKNGPLPAREAIAMTRDLAAALQHGYESGIIHRDVKPANVLLCPRSRGDDDPFPFIVKLADLGLARTESRDPGQTEITLAGSILGTPSTMAPEQFDDPDHVDFRADIYGLGCILYYALTGENAYPPAALTKLIPMKQKEFGPDPRQIKSETPEPVARLVTEMLAANRDQRPTSYEDLIARCDAIVGPNREPGRRWTLGAAAAFAVVVAGVILAVLSFRNQSPSLEIAAPSSSVQERGMVRLVASGTDPEGADLLYAWTQLPVADEPTVTIETTDAPELEFVAPESTVDYVLRFEVRIRDGEDRPEVIETIDVPVTATDDPPLVEIEPSHTVFEDTSVRISPTRVEDPEGLELSYRWSQDPDDPIAVELIEPTSRELKFDVPESTEDYKLKFWLDVKDGADGPGHRSTVVVNVTSDNDLPLLTLEGPSTVREGESFVITGTAKDPEGANVELHWRQVSGPYLPLTSDASRTKAELTAPYCSTPAKILIELAANDGERIATERIAVQVTAAPGLEAPAPGTQTDLFLQDPGTMGKRLARWAPVDERGAWGDADDHPGAQGLCLDGETSQSLDLPHGTWLLSGVIEPLGTGRDLPLKLGFRLFLGGDQALSLAMVRKGDGYVAGLRRLRIDEGKWVVDEELVDPLPGGWSPEVGLGFAVRKKSRELVIAFGEIGAAKSMAQHKVELAPPRRPTRLHITVEKGIACFCNFFLTGKAPD